MNINRKNYESWFLDYHEGTLAPERMAELFAFLEEHPDLRNEFEEFEMIQLSSDIPAVSFDNKDYLRREELTDDQVREWMIDILEGIKSNREELVTAISNRPDLIAEWNSFQQTILPVSETRFEGKNLLKKNPALPAGYDLQLIASLEGDLSLQEQVALKQLLQHSPALQQEKELFAKTKLVAETIAYPEKEKLKKHSARIIRFNYYNALRVAATLLMIIGAWYSLTYLQQKPKRIAQQNPPAIIIQPSSVPSENNFAVNDCTTTVPSSVEKSIQITPPVAVERTLANNNAPVRHKHTTNIPSPLTEQSTPHNERAIAFIEPLPLKPAYIPEEEPFVSVQRRTYFANPVVSQPEPSLALKGEEMIKDVVANASETVSKATENTPLAAEANGGKLTLGSRVIRSFAWVVGKASDDRIIIKTTFDPITGTLAAYEVETANRKWQKQF